MRLARAVAAIVALGVPTVATADTFVLVHGAFQDATCWNDVAPYLEAAGHRVVTVDLPGRDASGADAAAVTFATYVDAVTAAVDAAEEPVILVGHSFGGMSISATAERVADQIRTLIYVAAYVPQSGESMQALAEGDKGNGFSAETFVVAPDYSTAEILDSDQVRVFAPDADDAQAARLTASMIREPLAPIATPVELSEENFGAVHKAYVRTMRDITVSTALQTSMIERAGITDVRDIDTGHAPYLTEPQELARLILELAE